MKSRSLISVNKPDEHVYKPFADSITRRWTEDLTYRESMRYHFNRYLASPRMWPIGYLIGSPYSPLSIEQQIPERNWRDAFEDLLALESGGQMIDPESRERETIVSNRLWYARLTHSVSAFNQQLKRDEKCMYACLPMVSSHPGIHMRSNYDVNHYF